MTLTHLEDDYDHFYAPRFEVTVGGQTFREADGRLSGLTTQASLSKTSTASFTLNADYEHERGTFLEDTPSEDDSVTVEMGYGDNLKTTFEGAVSSTQPTFPANGGPTVEVRAEGPTTALAGQTNSRSWTDTTISTVIDDVLSSAGITDTDVQLSGDDDLEFDAVVQDDETDRTFLEQTFVNRLGIELFDDGSTVVVRTPDPGSSAEVTLTYGESLQSFRPAGTDASTPPGTAKIRGWDPAAKSSITATASIPEGDDGKTVEKASVEDQAEAQMMADANAYDLTPARAGSAETIGLPEITPGTVVELKRIGSKFSGRYYVQSRTHRIDDSGYTTSLEGVKTDHLEELA